MIILNEDYLKILKGVLNKEQLLQCVGKEIRSGVIITSNVSKVIEYFEGVSIIKGVKQDGKRLVVKYQTQKDANVTSEIKLHSDGLNYLHDAGITVRFFFLL